MSRNRIGRKPQRILLKLSNDGSNNSNDDNNNSNDDNNNNNDDNNNGGNRTKLWLGISCTRRAAIYYKPRPSSKIGTLKTNSREGGRKERFSQKILFLGSTQSSQNFR